MFESRYDIGPSRNDSVSVLLMSVPSIPMMEHQTCSSLWKVCLPMYMPSIFSFLSKTDAPTLCSA